jgi:hypothetical protein
MGGRGRRYFARHYALDLAAGVMVETVETLTERPYEFPEPPNPDLIPRGYEVVVTAWDGERTPYYPLMPDNRAWVLVSRDGDTIGDNPLDSTHNFGMETPTLSWQNGSQRIELYVDGMTHEDWMAAYGLEFRVTKNGFVTSKRMSRTLRDYRVFDRVPEDSLTIDVMQMDKTGEEIWDGAGLVSRDTLLRMKLSPHMTEAAHGISFISLGRVISQTGVGAAE